MRRAADGSGFCMVLREMRCCIDSCVGSKIVVYVYVFSIITICGLSNYFGFPEICLEIKFCAGSQNLEPVDESRKLRAPWKEFLLALLRQRSMTSLAFSPITE